MPARAKLCKISIFGEIKNIHVVSVGSRNSGDGDSLLLLHCYCWIHGEYQFYSLE
jgi:hypothetical protein